MLTLTLSSFRLCRADSRGVWQLPPRSSSCLLYLNGPAAALGVLTATAITGVTSTSGKAILASDWSILVI